MDMEAIYGESSFNENDVVYFKSRTEFLGVKESVAGATEVETPARWGREDMFGTERYYALEVPGYGEWHRGMIERLLAS